MCVCAVLSMRRVGCAFARPEQIASATGGSRICAHLWNYVRSSRLLRLWPQMPLASIVAVFGWNWDYFSIIIIGGKFGSRHSEFKLLRMKIIVIHMA